MDDKVFNGLLQATKEALAHYKGEKLRVGKLRVTVRRKRLKVAS